MTKVLRRSMAVRASRSLTTAPLNISVPPHNQDRERSRGPSPPTPPYVRVTYTAVRQSESTRRTFVEQR
jgi:hypothetical protein